MGLAWAKGSGDGATTGKGTWGRSDELTIHRPIPALEHAVHAVGGLELLPAVGLHRHYPSYTCKNEAYLNAEMLLYASTAASSALRPSQGERAAWALRGGS